MAGKSKFLSARIHDDEHQALVLAAASAGLTLTDYVRKVLFNRSTDPQVQVEMEAIRAETVKTQTLLRLELKALTGTIQALQTGVADEFKRLQDQVHAIADAFRSVDGSVRGLRSDLAPQRGQLKKLAAHLLLIEHGLGIEMPVEAGQPAAETPSPRKL